MSSCWLWGGAKRATSRILVFSDDNTYLRNYYLSMKSDLPDKIVNNRLIFLHSESDECRNGVITKLSFDNGIPEEFFLECKDGTGDIYRFENE